MDEYLLSLGVSDISLRLASHSQGLESDEVKTLLYSILEVEQLIASIERKGIPFREFLEAQNDEGHLPRFHVILKNEHRFVYSNDEFTELNKQMQELQRAEFEATLASIPEEEQTEDMKEFTPRPLSFVELYEDGKLKNLKEKLSNYSFALDQYLKAEGKLLDIIEEGGVETPIYTLKELIEFLRKNGRKGIEIQRYKGLGEMNADQLWETTMDPQERTLVQVTMPDAVAADHMFTMLMGDEVAPRRAFIESHALSVKNLDI